MNKMCERKMILLDEYSVVILNKCEKVGLLSDTFHAEISRWDFLRFSHTCFCDIILSKDSYIESFD